MDYSKLKGRIVEKFGTQQNFSQELGLSQRALSGKLNDKISWKQKEIEKAATLLEVDDDKIGSYFFSKKVQ
ncbi:DUF739 family protein [Lactococcus sp. DD01]|uniref:DUF739 family protein n=1 Tax=Lactococcus sp. DD01 TaxID=1776443 RepID=UPI000795090F|nr:DUF739 family protein [Lactococcus sp. DD01]KXT62338.1 Phage protein [Lactococcus sp. DD01]